MMCAYPLGMGYWGIRSKQNLFRHVDGMAHGYSNPKSSFIVLNVSIVPQSSHSTAPSRRSQTEQSERLHNTIESRSNERVSDHQIFTFTAAPCPNLSDRSSKARLHMAAEDVCQDCSWEQNLRGSLATQEAHAIEQTHLCKSCESGEAHSTPLYRSFGPCAILT